jgi:hypothetical protein
VAFGDFGYVERRPKIEFLVLQCYRLPQLLNIILVMGRHCPLLIFLDICVWRNISFRSCWIKADFFRYFSYFQIFHHLNCFQRCGLKLKIRRASAECGVMLINHPGSKVMSKNVGVKEKLRRIRHKFEF